MECAAFHDQVSDRLCIIAQVGILDVGAHGFSHPEDTGPGLIDAHIADQYLAARHQKTGSDKVGGGGNVPRHLDLLGVELLTGRNGNDGPACFFFNIGFQICTKGREHALCMISGKSGLLHGGLAFCIEPGTENSGLYLGGGHRGSVADTVQGTAGDAKGRAVVALHTADGSAHLGQRCDYPLHGTSIDGIIAGKDGGKRLGCQNTGDNAGGGATIAGIELCFFPSVRRSKTMHAFSMDQYMAGGCIAVDLYAETAKAVDGGETVGAA